MTVQEWPTHRPEPGAVPDEQQLDRLRHVGDPLADAAVASYFDGVELDDPGTLFTLLVRSTFLPPEEQSPALQRFFEEAAAPPPWKDDRRVRRGQDFFNLWVSHHFSAMYLSSLPSSYAAAKGVQVLHLTGRLRTDTERRLNETAQFLMDISAPGAFDDGGVAVDRILHVRLMHAAVRWLIANDPVVHQVGDVVPPLGDSDELIWSPAWGTPANQEDLVGTLLTFTSVVYDVFDRSGVRYRSSQIDDHLHLWRLIGHHLGIDPSIVPMTRDDADRLQELIWVRQHGPSFAGREMTAALIEQSHRHMPSFAWGLMPTAFRYFLGDPVADLIGVPAANWTRHLLGPMAIITTAASRGKRGNRLHAALSERFGRRMMNGILAEMRHGDRPEFRIPTHLVR